MVELAWADAIEQPVRHTAVHSPADHRTAWIHWAPEEEVVDLYRSTRALSEPVPAPWWLRAVTDGLLRGRSDGFAIEDGIHELLSRRPGWEYVPWALDGESGYWEFVPSESGVSGNRVPTTLVTTDRHPGWIDVLVAHGDAAPEPVSVAGLTDLALRSGEFEAAR